MTGTDDRVFSALFRSCDLLRQQLKQPQNRTLLSLHFTVTEAAVQQLQEIFFPPLDRRDALRIHAALLQTARAATDVPDTFLQTAEQWIYVIHALPQARKNQQAYQMCRKAMRQLSKLQAQTQQQQRLLDAMEQLAAAVTEAVICIAG